MFEQLQEIIRQAGQQAVVDNPAIPNEQNEAVLNEANQSINEGLQQIAQQQGPAGLTQLFQGVQQGQSVDNNPQMQLLSNNFAGNMMNKLGINAGTAKSIGAMLIPLVIGRLFNRAKDPNDKGLDIGSILGSLAGGSGLGGMLGGIAGNNGNDQTTGQQPQNGGMAGTLSNIGNKLGLDKDKDGDTDLKDLMAMFK